MIKKNWSTLLQMNETKKTIKNETQDFKTNV
jgi:hypothetical protein